ncbi:MAG: hypothetical protein WC824_09380 [Bacteroidota bacterium]|jgi:hypothetical protein
MTMKATRHLFLGLIVFVAVFVIPHQAHSQELADSLVLAVTDANNLRNTLVLGHHPEATLNFDWTLRESPVPPVPIDQIFDVRFLDPPGFPRRPATGAYRDIRGFGPADSDTFFVHCQPLNEGFPMRMKWNPALAVVEYAVAELRSFDGSKLICDMRSKHEITIAGRGDSRFMIIVRR